MTIANSLLTVADSISKISVSGVTVLDADQLPESALSRLPVLFLQPENPISDVTFERVSFGGGGTAKMDFTYTLNYRLLYSVVGSGGGLLANYSQMLAKVELILEAIFANDNLTGAVDVQLAGMNTNGPFTDPAGEIMYHGAEFSLRIMEQAQ